MGIYESEGKWDRLKAQIKNKWGKIAGNDINVIERNKDQLLGKVRGDYGNKQTDRELDVFTQDYDYDHTVKPQD